MTIQARLLDGQAVEVQIENGRYAEIVPRPGDRSELPWIAPGLIDIQINGFGGIDFNRPFDLDGDWHRVTEQIYAQGCTGFLIALITNTDEGYRQLLGELAPKIKAETRNCLGFHLEGPWLNPDPGYRGAHRESWMRAPDLRTLEEWLRLAGPLLRLITLAPEIDPAASAKLICEGRARNIRFFAGHSAALGESLADAVRAGVVGWTHLGNACPASVPKFDNVLLHALAQPSLLASLIPDGLHVPPHAFYALARALDQAEPSRLLLTTDAMAAAGTDGNGAYTLGDIQVEVAGDGSARLPGCGRLAGSSLTPLEGVLRTIRMAGLSLARAWSAFSTRPAAMLGFRHDVQIGNDADFCLLSPTDPPCLLATYHRGVKVHASS